MVCQASRQRRKCPRCTPPRFLARPPPCGTWCGAGQHLCFLGPQLRGPRPSPTTQRPSGKKGAQPAISPQGPAPSENQGPDSARPACGVTPWERMAKAATDTEGPHTRPLDPTDTKQDGHWEFPGHLLPRCQTNPGTPWAPSPSLDLCTWAWTSREASQCPRRALAHRVLDSAKDGYRWCPLGTGDPACCTCEGLTEPVTGAAAGVVAGRRQPPCSISGPVEIDSTPLESVSPFIFKFQLQRRPRPLKCALPSGTQATKRRLAILCVKDIP